MKTKRALNSLLLLLLLTDENDLEVAMVVLRGGTHIEKDEEERSAHAGTYLGMRDER